MSDYLKKIIFMQDNIYIYMYIFPPNHDYTVMFVNVESYLQLNHSKKFSRNGGVAGGIYKCITPHMHCHIYIYCIQ